MRYVLLDVESRWVTNMCSKPTRQFQNIFIYSKDSKWEPMELRPLATEAELNWWQYLCASQGGVAN